MFGGIKYRSEVNVQICAILSMFPQISQLLPPLKGSINELRKAKVPEMEAAVRLSLVLIERVMREVPRDARLLTLHYLMRRKMTSSVGLPGFSRRSRQTSM